MVLPNTGVSRAVQPLFDDRRDERRAANPGDAHDVYRHECAEGGVSAASLTTERRIRERESERSVERQDGQIPCESPRSSIGTSTNTAAGLFCDAHHAQTVRMGRAAEYSVIRLRSTRTPRCKCELRNVARGVMVRFVAMVRTFRWGPGGPVRRGVSLALASRVPCRAPARP
jgi:hypothetical protein